MIVCKNRYNFFFFPYPPAMSVPARRFLASARPALSAPPRNRCEQHKADGEAGIGTAQIETVAGIYINMEQTMSSDQRKS